MDRVKLTIQVLVYGTLKRGQWNHDWFCRQAVDIRPATVTGRLYHLPAGYPAVEIPVGAVLAAGTADPVADARTQAAFTGRGVAMVDVTGDPPSPEVYGVASWDVVHGEVLTFPDPARDMPPLDRLEGFHPGGNGLYLRSLVATRTAMGVEPAWLYHMARVARGDRLPGGCWPAA